MGKDNHLFQLARQETVRIASQFGKPRLYADFNRQKALSQEFYSTHEQLIRLREYLMGLTDTFGHGVRHLEKVAMDSGLLTIVHLERLKVGEEKVRRYTFIAHLSGLLHDIKRKADHHAQASSVEASRVLENFDLAQEERQYIVDSIANHEAFIEPKKIDSPLGQALSDCLYDADKFRWGPDNFVETLWDMSEVMDVKMEDLINHFPEGLEGIERIKTTFRTSEGKKYGPEFIDQGLEIGWKLLAYLKENFSPEAKR